MDANQTQQLFFNHIKSKLPVHLSFVDEMAEDLNISNDSAYRRIRGEKPITLEEMSVLCRKYRLSADRFFQLESNAVIFSVDKVDHLSFGFNTYLDFVLSNLKLFKLLENATIIFYFKDIPIFHYMPFPELSAFKFFFWKRTLMGYPELARQQFNGEEADVETLETSKKIIDVYAQIPCIDIWNEESINITIKQIEFYRQSNVFASRDLLLKVYSQLEEALDQLEMQAEAGRKFSYGQPVSPNSGASYDVFINECLIGDNTIYAQGGEKQITFINHNGLNFMSTQDKAFCDYTYKHLQNIMKKSAHISVVGEKERSIFFNALREKIYKQKKNI
jgi:hypothetical protein